MIETKYPTDVFEDAVSATAFIATVHVREGELMLPQRIREHIADGPVVVHLMRGQDDVAVHEATLTSRSTLTGIVWPDDVKPKTSLTVLCPRGGASHDVGVLLPHVERGNVDWPDEDLPAPPQPAAEPEQENDDDEPVADEPVLARVGRGLEQIAQALDTSTDEVRKDLRAYIDTQREQPAAEPMLAGPGDYDIPTAPLVMTGVLELPTEEPTWPGAEDSEERTDLLPAVVVPDLVEDDEPGTVFSAALVAVRTPPRRAGWLERRVREAARWVLDRSWTATRVVMASASGLMLLGFGLAYVVMAVTR